MYRKDSIVEGLLLNEKAKAQALKGLEKAIAIAGSQSALARKMGWPFTQAHIAAWLHRNKFRGVPAEYVLHIEKVLEKAVTRYELRPDIYPKD
jgi:DNA-binding transcriptional regulator YdaS (Cro superfamily)